LSSPTDDPLTRPIAPRQQRSRETLTRLLDAAEALLDERPLERITVADVVERAGSSVGSFYARFPTKEALVVALLERYHDDWHSGAGSPAPDLETALRAHVRGVVETCRKRRGLLRLRLARRLRTGSSGLPDDAERDARLVERMRAYFAPVLDEIAHPDPHAALSFAMRVADGAVADAILSPDISGSFGDVADDELVEQLVRMLSAYLRR
jgi:AcrR family transcriptional regulator